MIWLMVLGDRPNEAQSRLFEAALVSAVDHWPQAPSIAAARMAATCGVGLNNAMANGVNMLGDVHGGAGEQCAELYYDIAERMDAGATLADATQNGLDDWRATYGKIISGFGHRFHKPVDPRAPRLMEIVREAAGLGAVGGLYADIGEAVQANLSQKRLVEAGWLGKKTGRGFYDYHADALPVKAQENVEAGRSILHRILALLINEAADAIYRSVAAPSDLETAMTKGVNYPKGLLAWAEEISPSAVLSQLNALHERYGEDRYRPNALLKDRVTAGKPLW